MKDDEYTTGPVAGKGRTKRTGRDLRRADPTRSSGRGRPWPRRIKNWPEMKRADKLALENQALQARVQAFLRRPESRRSAAPGK